MVKGKTYKDHLKEELSSRLKEHLPQVRNHSPGPDDLSSRTGTTLSEDVCHHYEDFTERDLN